MVFQQFDEFAAEYPGEVSKNLLLTAAPDKKTNLV